MMAPAPLEDRLLDLLISWEDSRRQGRELRPEELCADCPALCDELRRRMEAVQALAPILDVATTPDDTTTGDGGHGSVAEEAGLPDLLVAAAVYRPQRRHAVGGQGEVLAAHHEELDRVVALKRIRSGHRHGTARRRLLREAAITARLQHPGIMPIYGLGQESDAPFYTMPLIQGQTLEQAIDGFHRDESLRRDSSQRILRFRGLLQQFIAVCNTMAYAHDQGVVHRDLKPSNIMLGPYGETLVLDWGLAKRLSEEGSAPDIDGALRCPSPAPDDLTATGSILGTPRYMSPEQAKGEPAGPASDVFALGLVLYAILTGKPAFDDAALGGADPLKAVRDAAVIPPRRRDGRLPGALEAVCLKALAARPADRYPSAGALADDVTRWLAHEPVSAWREPVPARARRWGRRHRTTATAAAVAVMMLLFGIGVVLAVHTQASSRLQAKNTQLTLANVRITEVNSHLLAANEREQARFNLAMDAVKLFAGEVSEDLLLRQRPFDGLRTKLLRGAAGFYGKLEKLLSDQTDQSSRAALGRAYSELGELIDAIGSKPEALAVQQKALAVRRALASEQGTDAATQADVARSLIAVGALQWAVGDTREALGSYTAAARMVDGLASTESAARPIQETRALAHQRLGRSFLDTGNPAQALASYQRALAIRQSLADANPGVTHYQSDLASTYVSIGVLLTDTGKPTEALPAFERAKQIQQKLADANPDAAQSQSDLARTLDYMATVGRYYRGGRDPLPIYEQARAIRQKLVDANPNILQFQGDLAFTDIYIGLILQHSGRPTDALAAHRRAIDTLERLVQLDPATSEYQWELAHSLGYVAGLRKELRQPSDAVAAWRQAVAIYERVPTRRVIDLYNLACAHAGLSGLAAEPSSRMTAHQGRAEADKAMEWLRRAVAAGYRNFGWMRVDADLDSLRPRSDFQLLMLDLAFPADPIAR
jgi:serine/threonine-protein kinase